MAGNLPPNGGAVEVVNLPPGAATDAALTGALALESGGNLTAIATNTAGAAKDSSLTSIKAALGTPLQSGTVTTQETPLSPSGSDGLIDAVNKMTLLLLSIDMRLQELPLRINKALNAGAAQNYHAADDFVAIRGDLANLIFH